MMTAKDKILEIATDAYNSELAYTQAIDSKLLNFVTTVGVLATIMGALFTYTLIQWSDNHNEAVPPHASFFPILFAGLLLLLISIGIAIFGMDPRKRTRKLFDIEKFNELYGNYTDEEVTEFMLKTYFKLIRLNMITNIKKSRLLHYATNVTLAGLAMIFISAFLILGLYVKL